MTRFVVTHGSMGARPQDVEEAATGQVKVLAARARHAALTSRLQTITAALSRAVTPEEVARTLVERALWALGASAGGVWALAPGGRAARLVYGTGLADGETARWERLPLDGVPAPLGEALGRGEPVFAGSPAEVEARWPDPNGGAAARSLACLPLEAEGRVAGGAAFAFRQTHPFDYEEQVFLVVLARNAAQALLRAQAYEAERAARRQAEAAFQDAQRAVQARDEVLAVVSHDLKNPLESVLLSASLLLRSPEPAQVRRYAEAIQRSAARMDRLIHELLDLSGMDAGRFRVELRPERLESVVEEALGIVAPVALERGVDLAAAGGPLADAVPCDRERILQVLSNLLGNALAFAPRGGHVGIRLSLSREEAEVAVSDDGPGIPPEDLPHVFDRFWKSRSRGTGLGLAIVRGIVDAHGGHVRVDSHLGGGSTFAFTLPRASV